MTTLVKLLKVSEYDRLNFDYGYSEGMENAEGSYGILNFYDDDDETYQITSAYGEYWYANYMFRQVKTLESRKHLIGERMIPKLIISTERGLPYDAAYNNIYLVLLCVANVFFPAGMFIWLITLIGLITL